MAFNSKEFSLFPLCKVHIVLGTCIGPGPVWRPQHWAAYAACPIWKERKTYNLSSGMLTLLYLCYNYTVQWAAMLLLQVSIKQRNNVVALVCMIDWVCFVWLKAADGRMEQRLNNGLLTGHAYAITNIRKVLWCIYVISILCQSGAMWLLLFVCLSVCLSVCHAVCHSVSRITDVNQTWSPHGQWVTLLKWLNFGIDPDSDVDLCSVVKRLTLLL